MSEIIKQIEVYASFRMPRQSLEISNPICIKFKKFKMKKSKETTPEVITPENEEEEIFPRSGMYLHVKQPTYETPR